MQYYRNDDLLCGGHIDVQTTPNCTEFGERKKKKKHKTTTHNNNNNEKEKKPPKLRSRFSPSVDKRTKRMKKKHRKKKLKRNDTIFINTQTITNAFNDQPTAANHNIKHQIARLLAMQCTRLSSLRSLYFYFFIFFYFSKANNAYDFHINIAKYGIGVLSGK